MPPTNQCILGLTFNKPIDDEKLVDFESLITVKYFFLKIIC